MSYQRSGASAGQSTANPSSIAAVERVPQIKPEDVEEVIYGNVLSAKYV